MRPLLSSYALVALLASTSIAQDESYPVHPDSVVKEDVPQGNVQGPFAFESEVYPGTTRNYWLYIPAQYDPQKPACTFVVQDGLGRAEGWKLPTVMDNLIADGSMPVTIGIFVDHGKIVPDDPDAQPRFNRSFEYDSVGTQYSRFLIDELLPKIREDYNLSDNPNDNSIGGASSGAVCAFNVAWERPDKFRRVVSTIGTYVGLRGGNEFPTLIRKCEPKPIRVFLQDGSNDLDIYGGDWWMANQSMLSALQYAGYEVNHVWGEGGHNGKQGTAIMPDVLRWLWKDYGTEIQKGKFRDPRIKVMVEDEDWKFVETPGMRLKGLVPSFDNGVFCIDLETNAVIEISDLDASQVWMTPTSNLEKFSRPNGLCRTTAGVITTGSQSFVFDSPESPSTNQVIRANNCFASSSSGIFCLQNQNNAAIFYSYDDLRGGDTKLKRAIKNPNHKDLTQAMAVNPDQSQLHSCSQTGRFTYVQTIAADGSLSDGSPFGYLHLPTSNRLESQATSIAFDTDGNCYVATAVGVQILDPLGRVNLILDKPNTSKLTNICFSGPNNQTLYAVCNGVLYKRKLKTTGYHAWNAPIQLPKPGL
jgi:enterochelin esterase-like enzyme